jgi:MFS family permease
MAGLDKQIRLLGAYGILTYPFACIPFLFFYFKDFGIDLVQYMWLIAWYYWAMVLMEIPTGIFADRFGRRSSLIAGSTILAAGFFTIFGGSTFTAFCVGEALFGIGHSLLSGAPTAMLFDSLKEHRCADRFLVTESRIHARRILGTGGSFLIGGIVASCFGVRPVIFLTGTFCLAGAAVACCLHESPRARQAGPPLLRAALSDLRSGPMVWILVYFVILFGLLRFAFHTYQPYFAETVLDDENPRRNWLILGVLFAALNLFAAPFSRLSPALTRRFRYRTIFQWLPVVLCGAFLAGAVLPNWLGVLCFFVHQVPFALHWSLIQEFVNQRVASVSRATALSILSFAGRLSFAAWIPIVGAYEEVEGTPNTYWLIGLVGLSLTVLWCAPFLGGRLLRRESADR